ncbi:MAG TPA: RluA family pseudouridine synthase [Planctomycetaceae bacterium]|nr:RluA family pseudouridine synthase [Planctomycetaceae bacterium]
MHRCVTVPDTSAGQRIDVFLTALFDGYSRQQLKDAVQAGAAEVDGRVVRPSHKLRCGQSIRFRMPAMASDDTVGENIELDILYEDDGMVVVNKPAGMVVHPAKGNWTGTLTSALAYRFQSLSDIGGPTRPGIVHRLDRETSGVIVVAKTNAFHLHLAEQWHDREVKKEYLAITAGVLDRDRDLIDAPIGKHPFQREKMAIRDRHETSRPAKTFYEVLARYNRFSLVKAMPETGRTHQIRVHMEHIGCPVLCDRLYGGHSEITRSQLMGGRSQPGEQPVLVRHALHASRLQLRHPKTGQMMEFSAPLAPDLDRVVSILRGEDVQ